MADIDLVILSAHDLSLITDWNDQVIIEWGNFARNIVLVNDESSVNTSQVEQNTLGIATNVTNISLNADEIIINAGNITTNTTNIGTNTTNITTVTNNLSTHEGLSVAHGSTGDIVGTGDTAQLATAGVVLLAVAVTDAVDSTVSVTSANATDLPTVITLANEMKGDVNTLVTDLNNAITQVNALLANLRSSGTLNT